VPVSIKLQISVILGHILLFIIILIRLFRRVKIYYLTMDRLFFRIACLMHGASTRTYRMVRKGKTRSWQANVMLINYIKCARNAFLALSAINKTAFSIQ